MQCFIQVSTACEGLCRWVHAIEVYDRVIKIVSPKKAKLAEAETELARQMDKLNEKRAQLQQVNIFHQIKIHFRLYMTFRYFFLNFNSHLEKCNKIIF